MPDNDDRISEPAADGELDVAIVGAGFSGLYMLHRVRDVLKLKTRVFEAADGVGGTWYWNRYPGARCDSESYFYCYSFSKDLEQEWTWTSKFPEQPEILSYLNHVADRFDLRRDIQLNTRVTGALFEDRSNRWIISTDTGETVSARFLISAVGCLSTRNLPDIPGIESFAGEHYHTGNWPHEGVDFRGKRVGLIGTGSTGIQAAPVIAEEAEHLYVFQRTPNFSVPARNTPLTAERTAEIKANYDEIRRISRTSGFGFPYETPEHAAMEVTPEERQCVYEQRWHEGGTSFGFRSFSDILSDQAANDSASDFIRSKIRETVKDPEVAELLIPHDHPYGTKRPPLDTNYFETYNRDNVTLVDVRSAPIKEITPRGVRTARDEYELDVIVFATGFDAMTGALLAMNIEGSGGLRLSDKWANGPVTYLGLQVAGFPNLFTITGPGSPSVLANMPVAIEQHVEWVSDCLEHLYANGISRIETTQAAEKGWVRHVAEEGDATLFPLANSWYVGANIPGKTRVFMPYVGGMGKYRDHCDRSAKHGYEGFVLSA
ncbi:MAG TPA: NAD(P)/FAD-dependent oxidoreductase [Pseudomonadales bacterium]|jgi:cation diffusion facilitator CzcD-associated flavoprotein CzcO